MSNRKKIPGVLVACVAGAKGKGKGESGMRATREENEGEGESGARAVSSACQAGGAQF